MDTIKLFSMSFLIIWNWILNWELVCMDIQTNIGNPNDNMTLSENRAKAVFDYLVSRGIDKALDDI